MPVLLSDVKGDLSGLAVAGSEGFKLHEAFTNRAKTIGLDLQYDSSPVTFWFFFGKQGHLIRATVAEMSPIVAVAPDGTDGRTRRRVERGLPRGG